ncbi:MAG TPA: AMP-dependent synthetase/ligase [Solirubrobacterales bacterium]|nr:AMP-dependent synthetase/ligase [Solirubrobacterales bacterium]
METTTAERYASGGPGRPLPAQNLVESFEATVDRLGDDVAIRTADDSVTLTWNEVRDRSRAIAGGLAELGVSKGDTVALLLGNRPEFIPIDLGAVSLGAVPFSIYPTLTPEQIQYVLSDAGATVAVAETALLDGLLKAKEDLPALEHVIVVDGEGGTHTLEQIETANPGFDPKPIVDALEPDDLLTLIYTSGTTGPPKGVQLSHRNLMSLTSSVEDLIELPERGGKVISWLPAAHIAERGAHYYLPVNRGLSVTICPDPRKIVEFLPQVRPTWFFAVPRIWEKLKAGLEAMVANLPDEQGAKARDGLEAGLKKVRLEEAGEDVSDELAAAVAKADEEMFSNLRTMLGLDEVVAVNVGAAPTAREVLEFFAAIGIPIGELWGMSETCGVATCNPPERIKIGTVGPPVPGIEVKLADDGEVMVKGDSVMPGYRNLPEKSAETIDSEGWLLSGDIGELDEDGYLRIVDRKKELIITAAGKNLSPANIESRLKMIPLVDQAVAIGDRRKFISALLTLDPETAPAWAAKQGIEDTDLASLAENPKVIEEVQRGVDTANEDLARVEGVKRFKLLAEPWEPGGDELTPTMKLKRKPIAEKYADEIEALYAD